MSKSEQLAKERTELARTRTMLAWTRTGMALAGLGLAYIGYRITTGKSPIPDPRAPFRPE